MTARRIGVLMGGESEERDVSRVTGTAVARAIAALGHEVLLLDTEEGVRALPAKEGEAPKIGRRPPAREEASSTAAASPAASTREPATTLPAEAHVRAVSELTGSLTGVDAVFIALHGGWGEDGTIQAVFEMAGVPYTGSGVLASALAMDKDRAKRLFREAGIRTPAWGMVSAPKGRPVPSAEIEAAAAQAGGGELIVKPNEQGSTVGLTRVPAGRDPAEAVRQAAAFGERVMIEQYIPGRELTVGILGDGALPIVEILPEEGLYTYEAKYTKGKSRYEVPANLPAELTGRIQAAALAAYRALGCEGFARIDFRLAPDDTFWCLEVNTIPGMTPLSLVPMAAKAAGISFEELIERILEHAIRRGTKRAASSAAAASAAPSGATTGGGR
jgi:D-alanine-D-alanine ligase